MGKKSRRNRPNALPPGAKSLGILTQEQVERMGGKVPWITPEKSEEFIKILERHPEHKTGDMSAAWREWLQLNGAGPDELAAPPPLANLEEARRKVEAINDVKAQILEARNRSDLGEFIR